MQLTQTLPALIVVGKVVGKMPTKPKTKTNPESFAHGAWTSSAVYVAKGKLIVSAGADGVVRSWTRDGTLHRELDTPSYRCCVGLSATSVIAAFSGDTAAITLWDAITGKVIRTLKGHPTSKHKDGPGPDTKCAVFSPDGALLASGGYDNCVRLWNVKTGAEVRSIDVGAEVWSLGFYQNGSIFAAGVHPERVVVIDTQSGRKIATTKASKKAVTAVLYARDAELYTAGGAGELSRWRLDDNKLVKTHDYTVPDGGGIEGLALSPTDPLIAAASRACWARVWAHSGDERTELAQTTSTPAIGVAFSPDGKELVIAGPSPLTFVKLDGSAPSKRATSPRDAEQLLRAYLSENFDPPTGEIAIGKAGSADRIAVLYHVNDEDDVSSVYFVTVGVSARAPIPYELELDIAGTYSTKELTKIAKAFAALAKRLLDQKARVVPEEVIAIDELAFLFPERGEALVTDSNPHGADYMPMTKGKDRILGSKNDKARLLSLRPLFEQELAWARLMPQAKVAETFLFAGVDWNQLDRQPLVRKARARKAR